MLKSSLNFKKALHLYQKIAEIDIPSNLIVHEKISYEEVQAESPFRFNWLSISLFCLSLWLLPHSAHTYVVAVFAARWVVCHTQEAIVSYLLMVRLHKILIHCLA
jgi:hypothetical protein